ncbi:hypothetical protein AAHE18_14G050800 [Arachis hypogaea]|nr:uncharacterized protein DS421_14g452410 [Arachis hypogaea]
MLHFAPLFNNFSEPDFANGLDNFTISEKVGQIQIMTVIEGKASGTVLGGLKLYRNCSDELAMNVLDSSELLEFSNDRIVNCNNNGNAMVEVSEVSENCGVGDGDAKSKSRMDQLDNVERAEVMDYQIWRKKIQCV